MLHRLVQNWRAANGSRRAIYLAAHPVDLSLSPASGIQLPSLQATLG